MTITIQSEGRRHYLVGDTYPIKSAIRDAGCKWDRERGAWWTGRRETAESLVSRVQSGAVKAVASFAKLDGGKWGVRVPGVPAVGSTVEVEGKYGRKTVTIAAVVETRDGSSVCSIVAEPRKPRSSSGRGSHGGGRCRECHGPIVDARHHRAMGGLCGACAFDEYDCC